MAKLGIIGGGQLGLFLGRAAHALQQELYYCDEQAHCPLSSIPAEGFIGALNDFTTLHQLFQRCDAIGFEFENVSIDHLKVLDQQYPNRLKQSLSMMEVAQNRLLEKACFERNGIPCGPYVEWDESYRYHQPIIIKTVRDGYDGKGQYQIGCEKEYEDFLQNKGKGAYIIEQLLPITQEYSVIMIRTQKQHVIYPIFENHHKAGILDVTYLPAQLDFYVESTLLHYTQTLMEQEDWYGILCVEYFVCEGKIYANEMAPRPHNSGHITMDTVQTSIYENTVRAWLGMELQPVEVKAHGLMKNIIGKQVPHTLKNAVVYDYYKHEVKPQRKMGHIHFIGKNRDELEAQYQQYKDGQKDE